MLRFGLFNGNRHEDEDLENFLKDKIVGSPRRLSVAKKSELLLELKNRFYDDNIDFKVFCNDYDHDGAIVACDAIGNYLKTLNDREILDYSTLENKFLLNVKEGKLKKFLDSIEVVLVDEYQDTNSLQERIYCVLAEAAIRNGGGIIVVGDDDQSLYRFRGATVDLFVNFISRFEKRLNVEFEVIKLSNNYRSTEEIVDFCNAFVKLDADYKDARVEDKNDIVSARKKDYIDYPILGIFRAIWNHYLMLFQIFLMMYYLIRMKLIMEWIFLLIQILVQLMIFLFFSLHLMNIIAIMVLDYHIF